jgi:hypothetical protein
MKLSLINSILILETVQDQIQSISDKSGLSVEGVSELVKKTGLKHWKWVLNQWYKGSINLPLDSEKINELIVGFEKVKSKLDIKDINQYKSVDELESSVKPLLNVKSSKKKRAYENLEGVEVVDRNGPYVVLKVSDIDSLATLGIGTKWCTRGDHPRCKSEEYIKDYGHIFVVLQNGRPVIQYTPDYEEISDIDNENVEDPKLLSLLLEPDPDDNIHMVYTYINKVLKSRWPEAEPYIMKEPALAFRYALNIIKGRWPEAEPYIMKDDFMSYEYARDIIKGRWPEAEPRIMKCAPLAYQYALDIIKGRWPEAEPYIVRYAYISYGYALNVIKGRWPEAEPYIMKDVELFDRYKQELGIE